MIKVSFESIMRRLTQRGTELANSRLPDTVKKPTTIRLTPTTQAWFEAQSETIGLPVAQLINVVLDGVVEASTNDTTAQLRAIRERFLYVFEAHGLDLPSLISVMKPFGLKLSMLDSPRLVDQLTREALQHVASTFHVRLEWLHGVRESVIETGSHVRWYKNVHAAGRRLLKLSAEGLSPYVLFLRCRGADFQSARVDNDSSELSQEPIGVVVRTTRRTDDGVEFHTYEVWEFERWNYWRCREQYKLLIAFCDQASAKHLLSYGGYELEREHIDAIQRQRVLPVTVLRSVGSIDWYPDDYACLRDPVTREVEDWPSVQKAYIEGKYDSLIEEARQ
ncbi:hypothetical protein JY96_21185 [Aquabacterium sp. NJ1]|uniref:hypothetical protein n=1 Tax=Aquabacterium sp. NJ1 TaxID=1538295 RepID=UPI00052D0C14|nr:hypothetical protein [Aquabacterium sp. NJ1]KGM38692.1 hypothetical protein JY96_21185 [Aquabacterium sp. NJ1]